MNASTDKEATVYWCKVASDDAPLAIDVLSDMLLHSRIDAAELRKEKHIVAEELGMAMDAPQDWVHTLIEEAIWPDHPLGRDVAGTRESVARLTRASLLRFMRRQNTPHGTVVSVAGRVDPERILGLIAERLGAWDGPPTPQHLAATYPADGPCVRLQYRPTEQANLCLATRGLSHFDPRRHALDLLNSILGGGMNSRLFVEVREKLGLVYDIHSYADRLNDTGMTVVYAGMDPEAAGAVLREILAALRRLRDEPVGAAELAKAKSQYRGRMLLGLEDTSSVANWCGAQELMLGHIYSPDEVLARVDAVTPTEIQELASELFADDYLRLAVIGPFTDGAVFEELLHLA
jgi:predicted Zn-dependent peptidase